MSERDAKADLDWLERRLSIYKSMGYQATEEAEIMQASQYWIARAQAAERKEQVTRRALEMACQDDWKLAWGEGGRPMWCLAQTSCPEGVSHGECGARYYLRKAADEFNKGVPASG